MKSEEWLEHEYKRLNSAVKKVRNLKARTMQEIKYARLQKEDDGYVFGKWVSLDRQLESVKDRRDLVYKIWKQ